MQMHLNIVFQAQSEYAQKETNVFCTIEYGFFNIETVTVITWGIFSSSIDGISSYWFTLHQKSCIVLVIMSATINFKTNSKDVLAEVLLNKKKKPELAKVYAKKLWKRQGRSNVALIRFYRQQRCFCVVLNTAKQWEHVTAQSLAKINWDSSLCAENHAVILALILKRFLLRLEFLADVC